MSKQNRLFKLFLRILGSVDLLEGMPLYWSLTEGPINITFGVVILVLSYRMSVKPPR